MVDSPKKSSSNKLKPPAQRRKGSFKKATDRNGVPTITIRRKLALLFTEELLKNFDNCESKL